MPELKEIATGRIFCLYCKEELHNLLDIKDGFHSDCHSAVKSYGPKFNNDFEVLNYLEEITGFTIPHIPLETGQHFDDYPYAVDDGYATRNDRITHLKISGRRPNSIDLQLPDVIDQLTHLSSLILDSTNFISLPDSFGNLQNLTRLSLEHCQLQSFPKSLQKLQNLERLSLAHNQIQNVKSIPNFNKLTHLSLNWNKIDRLPELDNTHLNNLEELDLSGNKITFIPNSWTKLSKLTNLYVYNNKLQQLPEDIGNLSQLRILYLDKNAITNLPPSLGNLSNLNTLGLSENNISDLPDIFHHFPFLESLHLDRNNLTELPPSIKHHKNISAIYISYNNPNFKDSTIPLRSDNNKIKYIDIYDDGPAAGPCDPYCSCFTTGSCDM